MLLLLFEFKLFGFERTLPGDIDDLSFRIIFVDGMLLGFWIDDETGILLIGRAELALTCLEIFV